MCKNCTISNFLYTVYTVSMTTKTFFTGRTIGLIVLLVIAAIVAGFYVLNNYIYNEKQADDVVVDSDQVTVDTNVTIEAPVFVWKFEEADSLNLDGIPETDIILEATYSGGKVETKLIDTTPGGCNTLPDSEDSVAGAQSIQCYSAGLGYRFRITKGENSYNIERKTFEEALPDYEPPVYEYEVIAEFPLS